MNKDLLIITTVGREDLCKRALQSLKDSLDILIIDGGSGKNFKIEEDFELMQEDEPDGLVPSWNRGYKYFLDNDYDRCILSNDDVIYPKGFSKSLLKGSEEFNLVGPLTNGVSGNYAKVQHVDNFLDCKDYKEVNSIQDKLNEKYSNNSYKKTSILNGFVLAWSRDKVKKYEWIKDKYLFKDDLLHLRGEDELCNRILKFGGSLGIILTSYIYHDKALTLKNKFQRTHLWTEYDEIPFERE